MKSETKEERCANCHETADAHEAGFGGLGCRNGGSFYRDPPPYVPVVVVGERKALYGHAHNLHELEPHYCQHVAAMTTEALHSKSDIAAELAWRGKEIERLNFIHKMIRITFGVPYSEPVPGEMEPVLRAVFEAKARITLLEREHAAEKAQLRDALQDVRRGCNNPNCECSAAIANRIIDGILKETA